MSEPKTCPTCKARHRRKDSYCWMCRQSYMRVWRYGLDLAAFKALLAEQDNACAICKKPFTDEPHVDHDHKTNKVRGLLCNHCNLGIGHLEDNLPNLLNAALYLYKEVI